MKLFTKSISASVLILTLGAAVSAGVARAGEDKCAVAQVGQLTAHSKELEQTLKEFVSLANADTNLRSLLLETKVMLEYRGPDSQFTLHLGVSEGQYVAGLGRAAKPAEITFRCDLKTLDRVLRGECSDEELQAEVRLGFFKKLGLADHRESLFHNLSRVYGRAIQNVSIQNQNKLLAIGATPQTR